MTGNETVDKLHEIKTICEYLYERIVGLARHQLAQEGKETPPLESKETRWILGLAFTLESVTPSFVVPILGVGRLFYRALTPGKAQDALLKILREAQKKLEKKKS